MSVSLHVVGFRPPDDLWSKHVAVWRACETAGVEIPDATLDFFDSEDPGDKPGMEIDLGDACTELSGSEFGQGYNREGYNIDVSKLPPGLAIIRVYQSW